MKALVKARGIEQVASRKWVETRLGRAGWGVRSGEGEGRPLQIAEHPRACNRAPYALAQVRIESLGNLLEYPPPTVVKEREVIVSPNAKGIQIINVVTFHRLI